jgi:hypothetical protein
MTQRLLKASFVTLLASLPVLLPAQVEVSGKEEERLEALARSEGEWRAPKNKLSVGFRILNSGGQVDFRNLGSVNFANALVAATDTTTNRVYSDGSVSIDAARATEKDSAGNQTSTPGGRYLVYGTDGNGNPALTGNNLAYTPGLTRIWDVASEAQFTEKSGYVAFHSYSAVSEGAGATKKQGMTGGVEFQISRDIGRGTGRLKWGVLAGVTLNSINNKSSGVIASSLRTHTDYYSTNGLTPTPNVLVNPASYQLIDGDLDGTYESTEITTPISQTQDASVSTDVLTAGGASVTGRWQVKGAYFMFKLGPSLHAQLTEHFGMTASLGIAGAYAGTRYIATESYTVAQIPDTLQETIEASTANEFLQGYFADVNLEWSANETMGLFGGITAQQLSDYTQKLGDRSAKVDLGSAVGIRGGVSIRF